MRKMLTVAAATALIALPLLSSATSADASCRGRKDTGTALGAIGGALIGNSVSRGGGGAVVGGLGGAVIGHQIAKGGCGPSRHAYYRRGHERYAYANRPTSSVYYDQRGNPVTTTPYRH